MLCKLAEKEESKKEKDDNVDDKTKEVQINENGEVTVTDNDELVFDATNDASPTQYAMTNTTEAVAKESRDDDDVCAEDRNNNEGVDDTKWGEEGGGDPAVKDGNQDDNEDDKDNNKDDKDNNKEDVMDGMDVLPHLLARRVERLKCLNMERERVMEQYL